MIDLIQFIVNPGDFVSSSLKMNETHQAGLTTGYYVTSVPFDSLWPYGPWPTRLLCPWGFSRQEYWGGLPCPPPRDLANPGTEPRSPTLQGYSLPAELPGKPQPVHMTFQISCLTKCLSLDKWRLLICSEGDQRPPSWLSRSFILPPTSLYDRISTGIGRVYFLG